MLNRFGEDIYDLQGRPAAGSVVRLVWPYACGRHAEYTADSFAVRPGANVEELLKRLPGIQMEKNGRYRAGAEVKKVLVDGMNFSPTTRVLPHATCMPTPSTRYRYLIRKRPNAV